MRSRRLLRKIAVAASQQRVERGGRIDDQRGVGRFADQQEAIAGAETQPVPHRCGEPEMTLCAQGAVAIRSLRDDRDVAL